VLRYGSPVAESFMFVTCLKQDEPLVSSKQTSAAELSERHKANKTETAAALSKE
jgi:hypothetical protein